MLLRYLIVLFSITGLATRSGEPVAHGMYLAVVQIDHTGSATAAQAIFKVFIDDLESAIRAAAGSGFQPGRIDELIERNQPAVEKYFQQHFRCEVNGRPVALELQSGIRENDVFRLTFALQVPATWKEVRIKAPFFTEIYSEQSNIIQLLHGGEKRFARLSKGADEAVFTF